MCKHIIIIVIYNNCYIPSLCQYGHCLVILTKYRFLNNKYYLIIMPFIEYLIPHEGQYCRKIRTITFCELKSVYSAVIYWSIFLLCHVFCCSLSSLYRFDHTRFMPMPGISVYFLNQTLFVLLASSTIFATSCTCTIPCEIVCSFFTAFSVILLIAYNSSVHPINQTFKLVLLPIAILLTDNQEIDVNYNSAGIVLLIRNIIVYIISYNNTESYCMYDHTCIVNSGNSVLNIRMLIAIYMRMTVTYFMNYGLKASILHEIVAHNIHRSTIKRVCHYIQFFKLFEMNIISTGYLHTEVIVLIRKIFNSVKRKDGNITSQSKKITYYSSVYRGTDSKVYYFLFNDIEHSFITTHSSTLATRDQSSNPLNYTQFSVESISLVV